MRRSGIRSVLVLLVPCLAFVAAGPALAQSGDWGYGAEVGFFSGTPDGSEFALGFVPERYLSPAFSVGFPVHLTPTSDYVQISAAATARFHFDFEGFEVVPYVGLGLVYGDLDRGFGSVDDTSYFLPLGVSIDLPVRPKLSVGFSVQVALTDFDFGPRGGEDSSQTAVMATVRYRP
ncbi:MAG: hypothetical protein Kow0062_07320 [Acidobacteriota bacterium]